MFNSATSNVTLAGKDSVPLSAPSAIFLATACSISCCDLMPTIFRNLRMLRLKVSSFISVSDLLVTTPSVADGRRGFGGRAVTAFRPVKKYPQTEIAAEVLEPVHDTRGSEQKIAGYKVRAAAGMAE